MPIKFIANLESQKNSEPAVHLCLETLGSGSTHLLFAHGWMSSKRMWYEVPSYLDLQKYTVHLLDFRGSGQSDRPLEGHDLQGYASDLRSALREIAQPLILIGHSAGGKISQFV